MWDSQRTRQAMGRTSEGKSRSKSAKHKFRNRPASQMPKPLLVKGTNNSKTTKPPIDVVSGHPGDEINQ